MQTSMPVLLELDAKLMLLLPFDGAWAVCCFCILLVVERVLHHLNAEIRTMGPVSCTLPSEACNAASVLPLNLCNAVAPDVESAFLHLCIVMAPNAASAGTSAGVPQAARRALGVSMAADLHRCEWVD
eukprot:scaffold125505_cov16-Tisochrysis_lutea.AAC.1